MIRLTKQKRSHQVNKSRFGVKYSAVVEMLQNLKRSEAQLIQLLQRQIVWLKANHNLKTRKVRRQKIENQGHHVQLKNQREEVR